MATSRSISTLRTQQGVHTAETQSQGESGSFKKLGSRFQVSSVTRRTSGTEMDLTHSLGYWRRAIPRLQAKPVNLIVYLPDNNPVDR